MNNILENLKIIEYNISEYKAKYRRDEDIIRLMAVTKTVPAEIVNFAIDSGVTLLGENRVQEYLSKKDLYRNSAEINFIGHLQTNKVKYIIDSVSLIHSVDSFKLAAEINRLSAGLNKVTDILIEVNIADEASKSGISAFYVNEVIYQISTLSNVRICGLMCIPPQINTEYYFEKMHCLFSDIKSLNINNISIDILSMGMSGDYTLAIKHGSNIVRIGSGLFGARK